MISYMYIGVGTGGGGGGDRVLSRFLTSIAPPHTHTFNFLPTLLSYVE